MVRVAIGVGAYPADLKTRQVYIALSIDEPIPTEFLSEAPEKIWCLYGYSSSWSRYPYLYPKILDIPAGTHTIYVAAYSPPSIPWKIRVAVCGTTDLNGVKSYESSIWLYKGVTDSFTVEISSNGAPYTIARFPIFDLEDVCDAYTDPSPLCEPADSYHVYPRLFSAIGCTSPESLDTCVPATRFFTNINPYKGEQFRIRIPIIAKEVAYGFNHLWWSVKEANYPTSPRRFTPIPIWCPTPYIYDPCGNSCPYLLVEDLQPFTPPLYVARNLASTDTITLQVGHVENDTLPPDQWTYVLDAEYAFNIGKRTSTSCSPPPPPAGASIKIGWIYAVPEAPIDIRPGRRLYIYARIYNNGTTGFWPFISVDEGPQPLNFSDLAIYIPPGVGTDLSLVTLIDSKIASQGYVTVHLGYLAPADYPSGTLVGTMNPITLQTVQVPLYTTAAALQDVKLEAVAPSVGARIDNVSLEAIAPAKAARIDNVSLEAIAPTRAARIDNVSLSAVAPPPPPPPPPAEYATIAGRVLGFLGPVANAEVSLDTKYTTKTKADGSYTLTNIPLGSYTLTAKPTSLLDKILYSPTSTKVDALAPVTITKNITLPTNWTALAAGAGGISIAAVVAATKIKPKPPAVY
jgi:hypothetical protein